MEIKKMITKYGTEEILSTKDLNLTKLVFRKEKNAGTLGEIIADEYVFDTNLGLVSILFSDLELAEKDFIEQNKLLSANLVKYAQEISLNYHQGEPVSGSVQDFFNKLAANGVIDTKIEKIN